MPAKTLAFHYGRQLRINEVVCPVCDTLFRADRNEDGIPEIPDQTKCADPNCETMLCPAGCMEHFSFACDGCGARFCNTHAVIVMGGEKFCTACLLDVEETGCTPREIAAMPKEAA